MCTRVGTNLAIKHIEKEFAGKTEVLIDTLKQLYMEDYDKTLNNPTGYQRIEYTGLDHPITRAEVYEEAFFFRKNTAPRQD